MAGAARFNVDFGFAPDSNINSATSKETVDIYGLPFQLDPSARANSGTGRIVGGDASIRFNRDGNVSIYLGGYGRWLRYLDHQFDDAYVGAEAEKRLRAEIRFGAVHDSDYWLVGKYGLAREGGAGSRPSLRLA